MSKLIGCAALPLLFVMGCRGKENEQPKLSEPSAAGAIANDADYEAKMGAMYEKMISLFSEAGADCDKLASSFSTYIAESKSLMLSLRDYGKAHPDVVAAYKKKLEPRTSELGTAMQPALTSCKEHKGLDAVMADFKAYMQGPD